jgi:AcrR family transcriptional regulator
MDRLLANLRINIPASVYIKDPESSELGKRIIEHSICLIDEMGIEAFTFKKLGEAIGSNESSIYRYFENKHKLLMYLCSWYWGWLEYQVVIGSFSLKDPLAKLECAIEIISREVVEDSNFTFVDEPVLNRIMINENSKSFLTKQVDL